MPAIRKRRARWQAAVEEADDDEVPENTPQATQRRRSDLPADEDDEEDDDEDMQLDESEDQNAASQQQLVKNLVRLALACEHSRTPVRRADINTKALNGATRQFKEVFAEAQAQLQNIFGMELRELPQRDKVTVSQRRAAAQKANTQSQASSSAGNKAWVLCSILPETLRNLPAVLNPSRAPTVEAESTYVGLYTFVIATIMLAGGTLSDAKLDRYLRRCHAEQTTPLDRTEKVLARMIKDTYIQRVKDYSNGEETVEYVLGPRGKVEVGEQGVAGLVRTVYGDAMNEELEKRLERTLEFNRPLNGNGDAAADGTTTSGKRRGRPPRERADENSDEE